MGLSGFQKRVLKETHNKNYLPDAYKNILHLVDMRIAFTSRQLADLNPDLVSWIREETYYSRVLKKLYNLGFLDRERTKIDRVTATGYEYLYNVIPYKVVQLKHDECLG